MEEQAKTIEQLKKIVAQQNKVIVSQNLYLGDMNELLTLQRQYIDVLEEQINYYQLLKSTLWN